MRFECNVAGSHIGWALCILDQDQTDDPSQHAGKPYIEKKNQQDFTFDTIYILIILEVFGFEEKLNSGQKSLCPNLDKIRSNTRQSVKIISFHFLYKP